MSKEGNFLIYCTEQYKSAKGLTGRQVSLNCSQNTAYGNTFIPALKPCIQTGERYIVEDIELYIEGDNRLWFNYKPEIIVGRTRLF